MHTCSTALMSRNRVVPWLNAADIGIDLIEIWSCDNSRGAAVIEYSWSLK